MRTGAYVEHENGRRLSPGSLACEKQKTKLANLEIDRTRAIRLVREVALSCQCELPRSTPFPFPALRDLMSLSHSGSIDATHTSAEYLNLGGVRGTTHLAAPRDGARTRQRTTASGPNCDLITLSRRNLTLEWGIFIFMVWLKWLSLGWVPVPLWVVYVCFQVVVDMV